MQVYVVYNFPINLIIKFRLGVLLPPALAFYVVINNPAILGKYFLRRKTRFDIFAPVCDSEKVRERNSCYYFIALTVRIKLHNYFTSSLKKISAAISIPSPRIVEAVIYGIYTDSLTVINIPSNRDIVRERSSCGIHTERNNA